MSLKLCKARHCRVGETTLDILAQRTVTGHTLLAPNTLTVLLDSVAFVESVTNADAIDSGAEIESIDSVLSRVKTYQRRGERIVSAKDLEDAILEDALGGNGIVRAFPFIADGQFTSEQKSRTYDGDCDDAHRQRAGR